jgi:hypothetical protein
MIVVVVVAVMLGLGAEARHRKAVFRRKANEHLSFLKEHRPKLDPFGHKSNAELGDIDPLYGWHYRLFWKYSQATHDPWLPVEPDPPEPK